MPLHDFDPDLAPRARKRLADRLLFDLGSAVGPGRDNLPGEVEKVALLMGLTGLAPVNPGDDPTESFTPDLEEAIRAFQRREGLRVDGRLEPRGPTITRLRDVIGDPVGGVGPAADQARAAGTPVAPNALARLANRDSADEGVTERLANRRTTLTLFRNNHAGSGSTSPRVPETEVQVAEALTQPPAAPSRAPARSPFVAYDIGSPTTKAIDPKRMLEKLNFDPEGLGELLEAAQNPLGAKIGNALSDMATIRTEKIFAGEPLGNSKADAFRHALWNYEMTREIGVEAAKRFADAHERSYPNADPERLMDLYNNNVGRALALDPANKDRPGEEVVLEAIEEGKLQLRPFVIPGHARSLPRAPGSLQAPVPFGSKEMSK